MLGSPQIEESRQPKATDHQEDRSDDSPERMSERANVKRWTDRIRKAAEKWDDDFERMKENMDFVASIQWSGQKNIKFDKYIVNMTLQTVNRSVATLYARNPTVEAKRRKRLDFTLWDGKMETVLQALQVAQQVQMISQQTGLMIPVPPDVMALLTDYQQGRQRQQLVERVGKTLEYVYQYQMDSQEPSFKTQMKQLVRRVRVCGVGYIKVLFCRTYENELTQSETRLSIVDRAKVAQGIIEKLRDGKITEEDAEVDRLRSLVASLGQTPLDSESVAIQERLVFDFPQATSIIPDPNCRSLKGFIGAHWVAEEFFYPLEFVNAFFEVDIKSGGDLKTFDVGRKPDDGNLASGEKQDSMKRKVRLWQVYDLDTKSTFIICDGHKDYVQKPEANDPSTKGFWNIFPVTFNDIEVEEGCKASIFPPSDVDLLKPIQIEKNRIGQALRRHRKANAPKYMYPDGALDEEDLDRIEGAEDQQFIGLKGLQPGAEPGKVLQPLQTVDIKPELYDTRPLQEDALLSIGQQEANIGPAQPNVTATVGSIAEQSRQSVASSDIDGLDDSLTAVAKCGGEMLLKEMSGQTVKEIAGAGAVWPEQEKKSFLNEIELEVVAASSGRPNRVVELQNWQQMAPLIMQAAQMPPPAQPTIQAVIRETLKRLDDRAEPSDFFPLPQPMMPQGQEQQSSDGGASKRTPAKPKQKQLNAPPNRPVEQPVGT